MLLLEPQVANPQSSLFTWITLGLLFVLMIVFMRRSSKKRVSQMQEQRENMEKMMTPGTWVRTTSGFFGKVVETSGEVITLENLTGEETLWDIRAIAEVKDPDFGTVPATEDVVTEGETSEHPTESPVEKVEPSAEEPTEYGSNLDEDDTETGDGSKN